MCPNSWKPSIIIHHQNIRLPRFFPLYVTHKEQSSIMTTRAILIFFMVIEMQLIVYANRLRSFDALVLCEYHLDTAGGLKGRKKPIAIMICMNICADTN